MTARGTRRDVHGVAVEIVTDADDAQRLIERRLAGFPATARQPDLHIALRTYGDVHFEPTADSRIVHETDTGRVAYSDELDELWIDYGSSGGAHCTPRTSSARIAVEREGDRWEWLATRPLLTLCLLELLKRHGLFAIHAAGVALDGKAVVLAGSSGSGKSTTAIALFLGGWSFLGDDILFLRARNGRPQLLAFPDEIDASPATFAYFPALGDPDEWPALPGYPKRQLAPSSLRPDGTITEAEPRVVALPVLGGEGHVLTPVDKGSSLLELVPNVLLTDVAVAQAQLDLLDELLRSCATYRLALGPSVSEISAVLASALDLA